MNPYPWESIETPELGWQICRKASLWASDSKEASACPDSNICWPYLDAWRTKLQVTCIQKPLKKNLQDQGPKNNYLKRQRVHCKQPAHLTWFCDLDLDRIHLPNSHDMIEKVWKTIWRCWVQFWACNIIRGSPVSTWCCEEQAFQTQNKFQLYVWTCSDGNAIMSAQRQNPLESVRADD